MSNSKEEQMSAVGGLVMLLLIVVVFGGAWLYGEFRETPPTPMQDVPGLAHPIPVWDHVEVVRVLDKDRVIIRNTEHAQMWKGFWFDKHPHDGKARWDWSFYFEPPPKPKPPVVVEERTKQ